MRTLHHAGQGRGRCAARVGVLLVCLAGSACGGEVVWDSPEASACASTDALSASARWEGLGYDGYAFTPGYFGFSPDGLELESPGRTRTVYDVETGAVLGTKALSVALRDREWKREVVGNQVLDVESRGVLLELGASSTAALSGDGRYYFWLDGNCTAGSLNVYRRSTESDAQEALLLSGFCAGGSLPTLSVTATGSAALVASGSGRLWHADFERGQASSTQVHATTSDSGAGMSVALSPDERFVAVLGADQRLRTFTYPGFDPVLPDLPAAFTYAFTWCYCVPKWFAPVAWSADGGFLAAADENGNVVVRRGCDGQVVAIFDSPEPRYPGSSPARASERGPMYLAFAPNAAGLAIGFEAGLHYFALGKSEP